MKIMQETTKWADGTEANHVYVFKRYHPGERSAMAIGYVPAGTTQLKKFNIPLQLDLRGRTFKELA